MATFKRIYTFSCVFLTYTISGPSPGGGLHVVRCTPLPPKRGGAMTKLHPTLFLISSLVYKDFLSSSILYCVYAICLNNSLLKLFPQTNQIKPSLKNICPEVRFWFVVLTLCRYIRHTYNVTNMFKYI